MTEWWCDDTASVSCCHCIVGVLYWCRTWSQWGVKQFVLSCQNVISSGVLLKMEVGILKRVWQRAWRYRAYLWSLRWVYAVKKNPEVGIRRIPAYTPQYTTGYKSHLLCQVSWSTAFWQMLRYLNKCCNFALCLFSTHARHRYVQHHDRKWCILLDKNCTSIRLMHV